MKKRTGRIAARAMSLLMSAVFAFTLIPSDVYAGTSQDADTDIDSRVESLLAAGDYEDGAVMALVTDSSVIEEYSSRADTEELATIEEETVVDFTEESEDPDAEGAGMETADLSEDAVLVTISNSSRSTEALLRDLLADDRVLLAEPNYVTEIEEEDAGDAAAVQAAEIATASMDSEEDDGEASGVDAENPDANTETSDVNSDTAGSNGGPACGNDLTSYQWAYDSKDSYSVTYADKVENFDLNPDHWNSYHEDGSPVDNATGVVCIMDSGVDYDNPDLENVMMSNMKSYNRSGGYYGYDASTDSNNEPYDLAGHGTHCAGIAAAEWNHAGTSGIASGCKLCAVKVTRSDSTSVSLEAAVRGYQYLCDAVDNGLNLVAVNCSWGSDYFSGSLLALMVRKLGEKGAITCIASGNAGSNHDKQLNGTDTFRTNPYVVIVNNANIYGEKSSDSDYGKYTTDLFAPGRQILSTWLSGQMSYLGLTEQDPLMTEYFHGDSTDLIFSGSLEIASTIDEARETTIPGSINHTYGYENKDSYAIKVTDMTLEEDEEDPEEDPEDEDEDEEEDEDSFQDYACMVYLPIAKDSVKNTDHIFLYALSSKGDPVIGACSPIMKDGELSWNMLRGDGISSARWNSVSDTLYADYEDGGELVTIPVDDQTELLPIKLSLGSVKAKDAEDTILYLDTFSIGNTPAPYAFRSGTSMAAPAVTGAASIIAKRQIESGEDIYSSENSAACAMERADILKGSVSHYDGQFEDYCSSGGMLDLSLAESQYTPVIRSLTWDSESKTVTIQGNFFGKSAVSAEIDGVASYSDGDSWSDDEISMTCEKVPATAMYDVTVTSANGITSRMKLRLVTEDNSLIMEGDISLPNDKEIQSYDDQAVMTGDGRYLYVSFRNPNNDLYSNVYVYDTSSNQWLDQTINVTEEGDIIDISMACDAENVYIYVTRQLIETSPDYLTSALYAYNIRKDKEYHAVDMAQLPVYSSLVCSQGKLYLAAGGFCTTEDEEEPRLYTIDIQGQLWQIQFTDTTKETAKLKEIASMNFVEDKTQQVCTAATNDGFYILYVDNNVSKRLPPETDSESQIDPDAATDYQWDFFSLKKVTINNSKISVQDLSDTIPKVDGYTASDREYSLTAVADGIILTGAYFADGKGGLLEGDSYILKNGSKQFQALSKRAEADLLSCASAFSMNNRLYISGTGEGDANRLAIRYTQMASAKLQAVVRLSAKSATYTGKAISIGKASVVGSSGKVSYSYYTDAACTKQTTKAASGAAQSGVAPVKAGTYYVVATVAQDSNYYKAVSDPVKLVITPKAATIKIKKTTKTYKKAKLKKARQTFSMGASVNSKGKLTYKIAKYTTKKAKKYLTINKKTGKITVKKGTPRGTYKIRVKVSAAKTANYKAATKTLTVKVVVK